MLLPNVFGGEETHSLDCVTLHYYQSGVQFTSLNHYGTLKVK
jgi:hypothetical protein